ncbi:hypothetical protein MKEN_01302900 [Mycena kentingensis (nom. inval.)]|nr:hypothetical protein MKEN_01302900 [Mycena kentingensis (nom. inval.)]
MTPDPFSLLLLLVVVGVAAQSDEDSNDSHSKLPSSSAVVGILIALAFFLLLCCSIQRRRRALAKQNAVYLPGPTASPYSPTTPSRYPHGLQFGGSPYRASIGSPGALWTPQLRQGASEYPPANAPADWAPPPYVKEAESGTVYAPPEGPPPPVEGYVYAPPPGPPPTPPAPAHIRTHSITGDDRTPR